MAFNKFKKKAAFMLRKKKTGFQGKAQAFKERAGSQKEEFVDKIKEGKEEAAEKFGGRFEGMQS